ncbi:uncharacterized protein LOC134234313 [Saccostrea cucullata]|uniref:uncharacterized protein LOC134234313 n=1 Tax=Saccostrea cuccullata TaxID=36930 RepID=UPI002ED197FE
MMDITPRSKVDFSISTTAEDSSDNTYPIVSTARSPWSFINLPDTVQSQIDVVRRSQRKSRGRNRQTPHSPRSKTRSPRGRKRTKKQLLDARVKNELSRAKSASPIRSLTPGFDPIANRHLWTMWRIAITTQIVSEMMERRKRGDVTEQFVRTLIRPPSGLAESIYVTNKTRQAACRLMNNGSCPDNAMLTKDFIFFGIPRVVLKREHKMS